MKKFLFYTLLISCVLSSLLKAQNNPCANAGFESTAPGSYTAANAVTGWSISNQTAINSCNTPTLWSPGSAEFSIVSTPIFGVPIIGGLGNSPLGGTNVAKLNNYTGNSYTTRLSQTIQVTAQNALYQYAYAGIFQDGHACCGQAGLKILVKDCQGVLIPCSSSTLTPSGPNCPSGTPGYSWTSGTSWNDWVVRSIPLYSFIGSCVTIEIICKDCAFGDHYGTVFFDAACSFGTDGGYFLNNNLQCQVNYCAGSNMAVISAPPWFGSYFWQGSLGALSSFNSTITAMPIINPVPGTVYTVTVPNSGCQNYLAITVTITPTQVSIIAIGSNSTCLGGASGSATVIATGSGGGYNYTWRNATNSVVGTASVVNNLPPGIYTASVSAQNAIGCGSAIATTTINAAPPGIINIIKPYCNGQVALCSPGGSNFQWYSGLWPISAFNGGTAPCFTINAPSNGAVYWLSDISNQGCRDSIKFTLVEAIPGSISIANNKWICSGGNNGMAVISMTPALGSPTPANWFSGISTGTFTPPYSSSINPTSAFSFTANNLSANGTYSVNAFDGLCLYATTFTANTLSYNFTLNPSSPTVCPGNSIAAGVSFSAQPSQGQYSYSWSPTTFLSANSGTLQNTVITPTAAPGIINTIIYTVVVTPTIANCPLTKTMSVSAARPVTPTIVPIPTLCANAAPYTITVSPLNGKFASSNTLTSVPIGTASGILTPSLASIGANTFTYSVSLANCVTSTTGSYVVIGPNINITGNTAICIGRASTLTATGANSYTWSNNVNNSSIAVSPTSATSYTVTGSTTLNPCLAKKTITVNIIPSPTISISGTSIVCSGEPTTLTASGATTFTWTNNTVSSSIIVSPTTTSSYSVIGTNALNTCTNTANKTVSVIPNPTVSAYGDFLLCQGKTGYLISYGADTYLWNTGWGTATLAISPLVNTWYKVVGTDTNTGCQNFAAGTVTVEICDGIDQLNSISGETKIYPNPNNGNFIFGTAAPAQLIIYNEVGVVIFERLYETGLHNINLISAAEGIYLAKIICDNKIDIVKLVKADQ